MPPYKALNYDPDDNLMFLQDHRGCFIQELPPKIMVKFLWNKMCESEEIAPSALFCVISENNPVSQFYNQAMTIYQRSLK